MTSSSIKWLTGNQLLGCDRNTVLWCLLEKFIWSQLFLLLLLFASVTLHHVPTSILKTVFMSSYLFEISSFRYIMFWSISVGFWRCELFVCLVSCKLHRHGKTQNLQALKWWTVFLRDGLFLILQIFNLNAQFTQGFTDI